MIITLKQADFSKNNLGNSSIISILDYYESNNEKVISAVSSLVSSFIENGFKEDALLFLPCLSDTTDKALYDCFNEKNYLVSYEGVSDTDYRFLISSSNELEATCTRDNNPLGIRFTEKIDGAKCNNSTPFFVSLTGVNRGLIIPPFSESLKENYPTFRKKQILVNFSNNATSDATKEYGVACASFGASKAMLMTDESDTITEVSFSDSSESDLTLGFNANASSSISVKNFYYLYGLIKKSLNADELKILRDILLLFYKSVE